jgi:Leucine-rich repeat (LRR) protein
MENIDLVIKSIGGDHLQDFTDENVTQVFFINSILSKVPREIFEKFSNLDFLSVANTQLTIISEQTFGDCGKVKKIDASNNKITKIIETSFKSCTDLEVLDVNGNPIEVVNGEIFFYDKNLKHIIVRKNY